MGPHTYEPAVRVLPFCLSGSKITRKGVIKPRQGVVSFGQDVEREAEGAVYWLALAAMSYRSARVIRREMSGEVVS